MAGTVQTGDATTDRQRAREQRGIRSTQRAKAEGNRLPAPPRQRRPALAALAVLLIVGGAAVAALLALRVDERVAVIQAGGTIEAGEQITQAHLTTTRVAAESELLIPESQMHDLIGRYASTRINQGQLIDSTMTNASGAMSGGGVAVGASLANGFVPASGLYAGDVVDLVSIASGQGETIVEDARVSSADFADSGETTAAGVTATFIVDREDSAAVANVAATNQLVVVLVERGVPFEGENGGGQNGGGQDNGQNEGE
ncbi:SAF domain-containing protein [Haloactinopolyspora alba]|uniref:SAF domain-containing protein n=1 Tax=Haloactinopolyspora alba TaxID=648780 RepID=A0A2P8EBD2_9ACTN|nr:SAF domain-containing protein [Haloactinopolyspora alba]PSL06768.1 SAF domain-containing protein [Haloactinopolyspora alba]